MKKNLKWVIFLTFIVIIVSLACGQYSEPIRTQIISISPFPSVPPKETITLTVTDGKVNTKTLEPPIIISTNTEIVVPTFTEMPLSLEIIAFPNPTFRGEKALITIKTLANSICNIDVKYSSGSSEAKGLEQKIANEDGIVSWTWKVGAKTEPGTYIITIYVSLDGKSTSKDVVFIVMK